MNYIIGDKVVVNKCDSCPPIVGKIAIIRGFADNSVLLNFGRGRPQANRPDRVNKCDVCLVDKSE